MTKNRISATVDKKTLEYLEKLIKDGKYRNKSHAIEVAIESFYANSGK